MKQRVTTQHVEMLSGFERPRVGSSHTIFSHQLNVETKVHIFELMAAVFIIVARTGKEMYSFRLQLALTGFAF